MATIEDVARFAGLSRTTVSRVINDQPYVSEEKRSRVEDAMKALGYVPNSSARRLRSQKTETIAVLLPRITNPFFNHLIESMEMKASEWGYQVIICQTHDSPQKERDYLELLRKKQVDGIILTSIQNEWEVIEGYLQSGPIVLCNENVEEAQVPVVHVDQAKAAYEATVHLIEQGASEIAFLHGGEDSYVFRHRERGFLKALHERRLPRLEAEVFSSAVDVESGRALFHQIRNNYPSINGVFAGSDEVAAGFIYEAVQAGVKVPEEISVVGFDNQAISMLMKPSITTVEQPVQDMGERCVELLIHQVENGYSLKREEHVFKHRLQARASTTRQSKLVTL
ncbi:MULTISPECIES: LacI family DNA-binding transcriptional regulator [Pontibacillus]|uniref:LacI family DNA-binding transcriptional regulator n=1 Tax=Pontibacillus chungwhensis TaxID=265426 RepID=A0ABY8UZY4_9BACI|nr:LacI family DNA-binding transcriptional regulator [Pontibacillus chungwhensis]MCD5324987.1 LacI family transcriptional regulator [Pontibacillus sp. HN14]WIF98943.1 LacI family DNA-binding transcriptional regulator [Pontibacillus chungwhensis]